MIYETLLPFEERVRAELGDRRIVIKPNFVVSGRPACATHADAVRGVLDFLARITDRPVSIGESPATGDAMRCFEDYGYSRLKEEYRVRLVDLNAEPTVEAGPILQGDGSIARVRLIKTLMSRRNYVISVSLPKTHDTVVATLTTKNVLMAAPLRPGSGEKSDKVLMHGGKIVPEQAEILTRNMLSLADLLLPDLAVLDGFEGMEGNGPVGGSPVEHGIALAGTDSIAVDTVGIRLMGIDLRHVAYLKLCGEAGLGCSDLKRIGIDGPELAGHVVPYKLHRTFQTQIEWIERSAGLG